MRMENRIIEIEAIEDELLYITGLGSYPVEHCSMRFEQINPTIKIKSEIKNWVRDLIHESFR